MINGSVINGVTINAVLNISEIITESIESHGFADPSLPYMPVSSSFNISSSFSFTQGLLVLENLIQLDSISSRNNTSSSVLELINLLEIINFSYNKSITESLSLSDSISIITRNIQVVTESVILNSSINNRVIFRSTLIELANLLDQIQHGINQSISENININDGIIEIYKAILLLNESINIDEDNTNSYINIISLTSSFNLDDSNNSGLLAREVLEDEFIISIPSASGQDLYLGYAFTPENNSVTTYTNYNFDGCAKFNGRYYFFNATGLYEYGGNNDDGEVIRSIVETSGLTFGTSNKKMIPQVYLGATNSDLIIMKVRVDGKGEFYYKLNKFTNELDTQKIKVGKGLIGRYFQFELITEAEEFNMESIEFFPIILKRKL